MKVTETTAEIVFLNTNVKKLRSVTQLKPYYEDSRFPTDPARYTGLKGGKKNEEEEDEPRELGEYVVRGRGNPLQSPNACDLTAGTRDVVDPEEEEEDVSQVLDEDIGDDAQEASGRPEDDEVENGALVTDKEQRSSLPTEEDRRVRFSSRVAEVVNRD